MRGLCSGGQASRSVAPQGLERLEPVERLRRTSPLTIDRAGVVPASLELFGDGFLSIS
jgi:hypothetical protein